MLGNFIIACGCASAFILLCCIIELIIEKIQDNKEKAKKRTEVLAWFREEEQKLQKQQKENEKNSKKVLTNGHFYDILNT